MSNNKQIIKLYTEEDVLHMLRSFHNLEMNVQLCMLKLTHIELPSDEEIKTYLNNHSYEFEHGFKDAIEFMKNKIQGGNK